MITYVRLCTYIQGRRGIMQIVAFVPPQSVQRAGAQKKR